MINTEEPEIGTTEIACWILVSIIPNDKYIGLDLNNWNKPSNITDNNITKYTK